MIASRRSQSAGLCCWGLSALLLVHCGGSAPQADRPTTVVETPHIVEPGRVLPAGARWVLLVDAPSVLTTPVLRRVLDAVIPPRRREAWAARYGIDASKVDSLAVGGYEQGQLLILRGGLEPDVVVKRFTAAMEAVESEASGPRPLVVGALGPDRWSAMAVEPDAVVLAQGAPEGWGALSAWLDGALPPHPALEDSTLIDQVEAQRALLSFVMLAPLGLELDTAVGVVFAGQRQLAVTVRPALPDSVVMWLGLTGEFPETIEDNIRTLFASIASQPLGSLLGMSDALATLRVERVAGQVNVEVTVPASRLVAGLDALFGAELWEHLRPSE